LLQQLDHGFEYFSDSQIVQTASPLSNFRVSTNGIHRNIGRLMEVLYDLPNGVIFNYKLPIFNYTPLFDVEIWIS